MDHKYILTKSILQRQQIESNPTKKTEKTEEDKPGPRRKELRRSGERRDLGPEQKRNTSFPQKERKISRGPSLCNVNKLDVDVSGLDRDCISP